MNDSEAGTKRFRSKGIRILGLDAQDIIKYFFSGNASLAIVILILICVFLFREAYLFFPDQHEGLKIYRKSGQEYVDYVGKEVDAFTVLYSNAKVAYFAEVNRTSLEEDNLLAAYRSVLTKAESGSSRIRNRLEDALDDLEDVRDDLEDARDDLSELDPVKDAADFEDLNEEIGELVAEEKHLESLLAELRPTLAEKTKTVLANQNTWKLEDSDVILTDQQTKAFREAILISEPGAEDHPYIAELKNRSAAKKAIEKEKFVDFDATVKSLQTAARPLKSLHSQLKKTASENKRSAEKYQTAPARKAALLEGAKNTEDPEEKARKIKQAESVVIQEPNYESINQPLYDSRKEHQELIEKFRTDVSELVARFPTELSTTSARKKLDIARQAHTHLNSVIESSSKGMENWRHDQPYSLSRSIRAFIFGKHWVTNSSWHDFYGLLPLLTGSLAISAVALLVAVPFSVAAAIYVNQIASVREQNWVKPAIEFIGAIPSVVLGFFGILVLGEALRNLSQIDALAWVPGFPMTERLTILNAGLLLAFMAIPTIFTLAEDAINNVPRAFTENSLALGASKLQTTIRVVVPTALSGIIAAVLLGFGRIVGETMVVLLVAGNKIKIPGSLTDPAHTMTGIIAQELGEVDNGSLHWRALFMVGMVLFFISLSINYSSQRILKRFQQV